jgi:hypothetical protein
LALYHLSHSAAHLFITEAMKIYHIHIRQKIHHSIFINVNFNISAKVFHKY